jgi:hypothetical protein
MFLLVCIENVVGSRCMSYGTGDSPKTYSKVDANKLSTSLSSVLAAHKSGVVPNNKKIMATRHLNITKTGQR